MVQRVRVEARLLQASGSCAAFCLIRSDYQTRLVQVCYLHITDWWSCKWSTAQYCCF